MNKDILNKVDSYYSEKISKHGAISKGVDWNGPVSHNLRFEQLCKLFSSKNNFSVLDYGCGYGALIDFLQKENFDCNYTGFDISKEMIAAAKQNFLEKEDQFIYELKKDLYDYVIANGIFNVKLNVEECLWEEYIKDTLHHMNAHSVKGFSFNILTSYSDEEYKKDYLFYANSLFYFDYCKRNFSKNVALLHDYDLYEFTILVKK
jgi:SAM-dependent methyltransferase